MTVGRLDQPIEQLAENICAVIKYMRQKPDVINPLFVQSIYIKSSRTISIPLYACVRPLPEDITTLPIAQPFSSRRTEAESAEFDKTLTEALTNPKKRKKVFGL